MTRIDICICTFQRAHLIQTLVSLNAMSRPSQTDLRIIVADNDETPSAKEMVETASGDLPIVYQHAPARNISIARNACLELSDADWLAFIDDDELAAENWLVKLVECAQKTGADAVFGPAMAVYGKGAPNWMVDGDYHSNIPEIRNGEVTTGHTCNALLKWSGTDWQAERFDIGLGQTGGEDTAFFFALNRLGADFEVEMDAIVHEDVSEKRLSYNWLWARKFRSGHSYSASTISATGRAVLCLKAAFKAAFSASMAVLTFANEDRHYFWRLRSGLHLGVCAGCLRLKAQKHYGS